MSIKAINYPEWSQTGARIRHAHAALEDHSGPGGSAEPTFLEAIALEIASLHGGTAKRHLRSARRMLEESVRNVEREERAARSKRFTHAA